MRKTELVEMIRRDRFVLAYLECAVWSSTRMDSDKGIPLDRDYRWEDFTVPSLERAVDECKSFRARARELITDDSQAGHDFWLTRNGHGCGFWDGDWPEPAATILTDLSKEFGEIYVDHASRPKILRFF